MVWNKKEFCARLDRLVRIKKINNADLAKIIGKKSGSTVSNWKKDQHQPYLGDVAKISHALGVPMDWLAFESGPAEQPDQEMLSAMSLFQTLGEKQREAIIQNMIAMGAKADALPSRKPAFGSEEWLEQQREEMRATIFQIGELVASQGLDDSTRPLAKYALQLKKLVGPPKKKAPISKKMKAPVLGRNR